MRNSMTQQGRLQEIERLAQELAGEASLAWAPTPTGVFRPDLAEIAVKRFMETAAIIVRTAYMEGFLDAKADSSLGCPGDSQDDEIWESLKAAQAERWAGFCDDPD